MVTKVDSALVRMGISFKLALKKEVRDLGLGQAGGRKRSCRLWKTRLAGACGWASRANRLRFTGAAPRLIATGAIPAAGYGASYGFAPSHLHRLRVLAAKALVGTLAPRVA